MHFQHLTYWQDKAKTAPLRPGYLLTVPVVTPPIMPRLKPSIPQHNRRWRTWPGAGRTWTVQSEAARGI